MSETRQIDHNATVNQLPVLSLHPFSLFPGTVMSVEVRNAGALRMLEELVQQQGAHLLVAVQKDPAVESPGAVDLHPVVVEAEVLKLIRLGKNASNVVLRGLGRRHMTVVRQEPYLVAQPSPVEEVVAPEVEAATAVGMLREAVQRLAKAMPELARTGIPALEQTRDPGTAADIAAACLGLPPAEQLALLAERDIKARLDAVLKHVLRTIEVGELTQRINQQVQEDIVQKQRDYVLRQRLKAIQEELGEGGEDNDLDQYDERIAKAGMPDDVEKVARRQLNRLQQLQSGAPEYSIQRTYLDWLCDLPWSHRTEDLVDLAAAKAVLEADHHGLAKVKKRVLEYLAVRKLAPQKKGPILCLAGPPGVGKTSLGRSIAKALGREFVRMSLGGVRDEAEVRGHRRTYVGALPGRIIQALKRSGTKNPVMLLDEIDKLSADHRGDPSSALLEVLDPEQNGTFSDHYLEVPFDLSEVIFIATANRLDTIPGPLLDRMELIELPGYTASEKRTIARNHLIPRQMEEHGLRAGQVHVSDAALGEVIEHYTREAGVRNLERELASILRGVTMQIASDEAVPAEIDTAAVATYLGPARYDYDIAEQMQQPGVATGLAWTPVGGDILYIEVTDMLGKGRLAITGQLGSVMQESAQAAMSWVRTHGSQLGLVPEFFEQMDVHVHVPQGGTPKDGPSAGVALLSAMVSLLTRRRVRSDVAMTGEITLRGAVLPVGGIKEKVLAAHRAGIKRVVLPERNGKDLVDVPAEVKSELEFILVRRVEEALDAVLESPWREKPAVPAQEELADPSLLPSLRPAIVSEGTAVA